MRKAARDVVRIIVHYPIKSASKATLEEWKDILADEIKLNESCHLRTDGYDSELRTLYACKGTIHQKLSNMEVNQNESI